MKRYYTKPPADSAGNNPQDRPSLAAEDDSAAGDGAAGPRAPETAGFNAVKGTSFGVKTGEVFSLLGVNGAGKSSTFNCLVGQQRVSGGVVLIDGDSVDQYVGQPEKLHGIIGYCPQTNIFDGTLTVRQQVTFVCRLVGIPDDQLAAYANSTIRRFGLARFADTHA